jgi:hypothetical protein
VRDLSGQVLEHPVADPSREERSGQPERDIESPLQAESKQAGRNESERCSHVIVSAERCLGGPSQSCHGEGNRQDPASGVHSLPKARCNCCRSSRFSRSSSSSRRSRLRSPEGVIHPYVSRKPRVCPARELGAIGSIGSSKMSPKGGSLGHVKSNRSARAPALPAPIAPAVFVRPSRSCSATTGGNSPGYSPCGNSSKVPSTTSTLAAASPPATAPRTRGRSTPLP